MRGYTVQEWQDGSGGGTPIDADSLNHIESGVFNAYPSLDTVASDDMDDDFDGVSLDAKWDTWNLNTGAIVVNDGLYLGSGNSGLDFQAITQDLPGGACSFMLKGWVNSVFGNTGGGIMLCEGSSSQKAVCINNQVNSDIILQSFRMSSHNGYDGADYAATASAVFPWLRIDTNGTTGYSTYVSYDQRNWIPVYSGTYSGATWTKVGIYVFTTSGTSKDFYVDRFRRLS